MVAAAVGLSEVIWLLSNLSTEYKHTASIASAIFLFTQQSMCDNGHLYVDSKNFSTLL